MDINQCWVSFWYNLLFQPEKQLSPWVVLLFRSQSKLSPWVVLLFQLKTHCALRSFCFFAEARAECFLLDEMAEIMQPCPPPPLLPFSPSPSFFVAPESEVTKGRVVPGSKDDRGSLGFGHVAVLVFTQQLRLRPWGERYYLQHLGVCPRRGGGLGILAHGSVGIYNTCVCTRGDS